MSIFMNSLSAFGSSSLTRHGTPPTKAKVASSHLSPSGRLIVLVFQTPLPSITMYSPDVPIMLCLFHFAEPEFVLELPELNAEPLASTRYAQLANLRHHSIHRWVVVSLDRHGDMSTTLSSKKSQAFSSPQIPPNTWLEALST